MIDGLFRNLFFHMDKGTKGNEGTVGSRYAEVMRTLNTSSRPIKLVFQRPVREIKAEFRTESKGKLLRDIALVSKRVAAAHKTHILARDNLATVSPVITALMQKMEELAGKSKALAEARSMGFDEGITLQRLREAEQRAAQPASPTPGAAPGMHRAHSFRHGFATRILQQTGDLRLVQAALHHRSIVSTTVYAQVGEARLRAAIGL